MKKVVALLLAVIGMFSQMAMGAEQPKWRTYDLAQNAGLYLLELPYDDAGGTGHPCLDAHYICAEMLVVTLEEILWQ